MIQFGNTCDFRPSGEAACNHPVENIALDAQGKVIACVCDYHGDCLATDNGHDDWTWFIAMHLILK